MKQILILTLLSLLLFNSSNACLNGEIKMLKDGTFLFEDFESNVPYGHEIHTKEFPLAIKRLDSLYMATKDLDYLSDKGLLLILLGKYKQAIKLYLEIEKIEPNRYSTASNIGTAYELAGQNYNALKWIKKSVEIDPKSHKNSEWLHVRILEAKIKGDIYVTSKFLLNTDFGTNKVPVSELTKKQLEDLNSAIYYQLNERITFVKPKDKIVAQLFFDLGNIEFLLNYHTIAKLDYDQALLYGFNKKLIHKRIKQAYIEAKKPRKEEKPLDILLLEFLLTYGIWILLSILILTITIICLWIIKRKK